MAGLQDIKKRINSVKSTHKLIAAMKLIAASRFRQSVRMLQIARNYESSLAQALQQIMNNGEQYSNCRKCLPAHVFEEDPTKPHIICVFGAQKGLCGSYNMVSVKEALAVYNRYRPRACEFVPMTLKAAEYFVKHKPNVTEPLAGLGHFSKHATCMELAVYVFDHVKKWYQNGEVGSVSLVAGNFVNTLTQGVTSVSLYPNADLAKIELIQREYSGSAGAPRGADGSANIAAPSNSSTQSDSSSTSSPSTLINPSTPSNPLRLEPSIESVIEPLLDNLTLVRIYKAFLESETCEFAGRMTMMDSSKRNAEELIDKLSLRYNRTRQTNITNELIEIIAGTVERN
ncbi:MAG: F0F1 ATP synthase subunit gamma [Holosporales bacterium]|jgi:F-type H+-transporting ATPase subunit gamma|nr:F0F1 ATP synthase subunit gamma [Holosporales bacterium]